MEPFVNGSHLGWLGTDFRKLRAATTHVDRTMVELSVLKGRFTDGELIALGRGLRPAVSRVRDRILATPLVDLCYQRRHVEPPIAVPVGYWAHTRRQDSSVTVYRHARGRQRRNQGSRDARLRISTQQRSSSSSVV